MIDQYILREYLVQLDELNFYNSNKRVQRVLRLNTLFKVFSSNDGEKLSRNYSQMIGNELNYRRNNLLSHESKYLVI